MFVLYICMYFTHTYIHVLNKLLHILANVHFLFYIPLLICFLFPWKFLIAPHSLWGGEIKAHTHAHNKLYGRSCMCIRSGTHVNAFSGLFRLKANNGSKAAAVSEGTNKLVLDRDGVCLMRRRVWSKDVKRRAILVRKIWNEINFSPKEINEQVRGEANTCTIWCVCPFVRQCLHSVVGVVKVKIWEN